MTQVAVQEFSLKKKPLKNITSTLLSRLNITLKWSLTSCRSDQTSLGMWVLLSLSQLALHHKMSPWLSTPEVNSPGFTATKHYPTQLHSTRPDPHLTKLVLHPPAPTGPRTSLYLLHVTPTNSAPPPFLMLTLLPPMEISRPMSSTLGAPIFPVWTLGVWIQFSVLTLMRILKIPV